MKLTYKQTIALDILENSFTEELLFGGGAGGGKSVLGSYWILKNCLRYNGTRWLIGRSKLKSLYDTTVRTLIEVCKMQGLRANVDYNLNRSSSIITFFNGSEIFLRDLFLYPSDPEFDNLGSLEITGAFVDEANQISEKARDILNSRIRYKLDEFGLIPKTLYTCNPAKNWTYSDFYLPQVNGTIREYRKFLSSLVTDNPFISKHYIRNLGKLKEAEKQRLLFGNFEYDADPTSLINTGQINDLFENNHIEEGHQRYIVSDIARFGSDKAVIMVWYGFVVKEIVTIDVSDTVKIQNIITALRSKHSVNPRRCIADEDGVGGGVVDNLRILGFSNGGKPFDSSYNNLKSECGYKLADMIDEMYIDVELSATIIDAIRQELGQLKTYDADKDSKLRILPKEKIKENIGRSPDYLDTFIMRMYFELASTTITSQATIL